MITVRLPLSSFINLVEARKGDVAEDNRIEEGVSWFVD